MKTSNTKRMLAFWLAVAMLTTGVPTAFALHEQLDTSVNSEMDAQPAETLPAAPIAQDVSETRNEVAQQANTTIDHIALEKGTVIVKGGDAGDQKIQATAYSNSGNDDQNKIKSGISWTIDNNPDDTNVSIDGSGVITVKSKAKEDTYTIKATVSGGGSNTATLKVNREGVNDAYKIEVTGDTTIEIPANNEQSVTKEFTAKVTNAFDEDITSSKVITWGVDPTKPENIDMVSVATDGTLAVQPGAVPDTVNVIASCGGIKSAEKTVTLQYKESELKSITEVWAKPSTGKEINITDGLTLVPGESVTLFVKGPDQYGNKTEGTEEVTASVKDSSSDTLTVQGKTVTGKSAGKKTITVKSGELQKEVAVTVRSESTKDCTIEISNASEFTGKNFTYGDSIPDPTVTIKKSGTIISGSENVHYEYREIPKEKSTLRDLSEKPKNAGSYQVVAYYDAGSVHAVSAPVEFTIERKQVTVTADNKVIRQGEAIPEFTFAVPQGALVNGDTPDALDVKLFTTATTTSQAGTYDITGTSNSRNYDVTVDKGTLTITSSVLSIGSARQVSSNDDDNYSNFSVFLRDTGLNGYARIDANANDYLQTQRIDGTTSEWIGMVISPKNKTVNSTQGLYVSDTTGANKIWSSLGSNGIRLGDFYIRDVSSTDFELWYDTDDRDCSKSLYLATDANGSNLFEIKVDFDSYAESSDKGGSGSSKSNTTKVNGDKVSTTTVDKKPSVKSGSATVSFTSSALSNALDKNKREAKREKADKSFIELDVKSSKSVDDTTITIPRKSLDAISDEDTGLKLTTSHGTLALDDRALASIYKNSSKTDLDFYVQKDKNKYTLQIKDGSNHIVDLGSGDAEITFEYKLKSGEKASDVKVYRIGDGKNTWLSAGDVVYGGTGTYAAATGNYITDMKADYSSSKKKVTFNTDALGKFLVTTETLTAYTPSYPGNTRFLDVPSSRWSAPYIEKLASLGMINGTGGGYFQPTLYITREEFVAMLARMDGVDTTKYYGSRFPDISSNRWSAPYIEWAASRGITTGTDGGRFAPEMGITRQEMATMIYRYVQAAGKKLPQQKPPMVFADAATIDGWAQVPVITMQQAGIIDGNVTNGLHTFDPLLPATREECAKMLANLHDKL